MMSPTAGLLIALAEMAMAGGIGAQLLAAPASIVPHAYWFGEDQARYVVTVAAEQAGLVLAKMKGAGVPCARIGTTGGDAIVIGGEGTGLGDSAEGRLRGLVPGLHERQGVRPHDTRISSGTGQFHLCPQATSSILTLSG